MEQDPSQVTYSTQPEARKSVSKKKIVAIGVYLVLLVGLPLFIYYSQQQQNTRQFAAEPVALLPASPFPVAKNTIDNPMLSKWSGQITARVVKKVPYVITLAAAKVEKDASGNVKVSDLSQEQSYPVIFESPSSKIFNVGKPQEELGFSGLSDGDVVKGTVEFINIAGKWQRIVIALAIQTGIPKPENSKEPVSYNDAPDLYTLIKQSSPDLLYANAEGSVTSKATDSFVLEKDGNRLNIFVEENQGITTFANLSDPDPKNPAQSHFSDLKIGQTVKGGIGILVSQQAILGKVPSRSQGDIIAHYMTIQK